MKKEDILKAREENLMNYIWDNRKLSDEAFTVSELAGMLENEGWSTITVFKTVQSLTNKNYLKIAGLERSSKSYARKLMPTMTKEQYYAQLLLARGLDASFLKEFVTALAGTDTKASGRRRKDEAVIARLEEIIDEIEPEAGKDEENN